LGKDKSFLQLADGWDDTYVTAQVLSTSENKATSNPVAQTPQEAAAQIEANF
jgi:hypothetical protein|tara:strand:- start:552 stop:707 length:156 start_codon:yes stop_codon:yes gene_type:complete